MMEPNSIFYNDLTLDDEKQFSINFSHEDLLEGVVLRRIKTII